jgi:drug/metabolite transporter (DMT)-like permease
MFRLSTEMHALTMDRMLAGALRSAISRPVDAALLLVAVAWGSSYLAAKDAVPADGVFAFLALRFAVAVLGLAIVIAPRLRGVTRSELLWGSCFGAILSVILILETFGITKTSAANAGLIISLTIVITPLLVQRSRRLPRAFFSAAGLAVVGVVVLTQSSRFAVPGLGDLLIALAAVARSVHVTVIARCTTGRTLDSARVTLVQLCCALGVFVVLSSFTGHGIHQVAAQLGLRSWLLLSYLALVCTVVPFMVQIWATRRVSPTRVSLLLGTEPLWAAVFGVLLAGEPVTLVGVLGALMILVGIHRARRAEDGLRGEHDVLGRKLLVHVVQLRAARLDRVAAGGHHAVERLGK